MKRLKKLLDGLEPADCSLSDFQDMVCQKIGREVIPIPGLVFYMLVNKLDYPYHGTGDKVLWTIYGRLNGEPVQFTYQKFGFKICIGKTSGSSVDRIVGQLLAGLNFLEKLLAPYARKQFEENAVIIKNLHYEFEDRYQYFRELSSQSFDDSKKAPPKLSLETVTGGESTPSITDVMSEFIAQMNHETTHKREGYYLTMAMVDAYFSYLEHRLLLLLALRGREHETGFLNRFLSMRWDVRFEEIFGKGTTERQDKLSRLRKIKSKLRNPSNHGGVENDRGSFHFFFLARGVFL